MQPVLLLGETGTGKSLCARLIHEASDRSSGKFIAYHPNFGGADIAQSELFGHVRGAFTGALADRNGLLREAHGGTLFLDEIDELPPEIQVRLLDVLQEQRVRPVGSDSFIPINCRVIAATNRPLTELVSGGKFRLDLYHRIAHCTVTLPPLRLRREDLLELATSALSRFTLRENATILGFEECAIAALMKQEWPGNVRELNAVVEAAAYRARYERSERVRVSHLPFSASVEQGAPIRPLEQPVCSHGLSLHEQIETFKIQAIQDALSRCNGNQVAAARELGVDRGTIRRALRGNGDLQ
jgi:transcriptional regulator with PAS, ATPase and Fis domain